MNFKYYDKRKKISLPNKIEYFGRFQTKHTAHVATIEQQNLFLNSNNDAVCMFKIVLIIFLAYIL